MRTESAGLPNRKNRPATTDSSPNAKAQPQPVAVAFDCQAMTACTIPPMSNEMPTVMTRTNNVTPGQTMPIIAPTRYTKPTTHPTQALARSEAVAKASTAARTNEITTSQRSVPTLASRLKSRIRPSTTSAVPSINGTSQVRRTQSGRSSTPRASGTDVSLMSTPAQRCDSSPTLP
jgi:hypothetical protein